jgi:hypothetical protein
MRELLRSALLLSAFFLAILSLFGRVRPDTSRSLRPPLPTDDDAALWVG